MTRFAPLPRLLLMSTGRHKKHKRKSWSDARSPSSVLGKCYSTAVGEGPFPGELLGEEGDHLREIGQEYDATTGRPRRCAWLDVVALKYATMLSGFTSLVVTKLDVLDYFDEVKICVAYKIDGEVTARSVWPGPC